MAKIVRRSVDTSIEQNILTASIISSHYLEKIWPLYQKEYMTNTFAKKVMEWVLDYYDNFGESPKHHIKDIFNVEKGTLDDAEMEIIQIFLENLSKRYVDDQGVNDDYLLHQTMEYFRKREIEIRVSNAQSFLTIGRLDKAEEELTKMKKVMLQTSNWSNPFDSASINNVFDERNKGIFRFPGALGDLLGGIERGWFIAWLAPFKRGKTFMLLELVIIAALCGLKAVFVSLEMSKKAVDERIYKRITAYGEAGLIHIIPVFDCLKNQLGVCGDSNCKGSNLSLGDSKETIADYSEDLRHKVCTNCKNIKGSPYEQTTWFEPVTKKDFTSNNVHKKMRAMAKMYGENIRTISYPRFSASVADLNKDLDILEQTEGFIADVLAADYADIFRPASTSKDSRGSIDDIWKDLAAMCAIRHLIGGTASQGTRGAIYKSDLGQDDLAEWIGKLAHVDIFTAINQTPEEKRKGVIRQALLAHRHKEFDEKKNVTILQALSLGQVHLDSSY